MSTLLEVQNLKKYFSTPAGMLHAVDGVTFKLEEGTVLGVVGESGCGKSTLGRTILGLLEATDGKVLYRGEDITHLKSRERDAYRKKMQIIFQDPYSSLDPRMTVFSLIADPIKAYEPRISRAKLDEKVLELMNTVGLAERLIYSYPHELDGGRRQRIGIARTLALDPEFIVCDEPVSALDVSIQAQILNLLQDLQDEKKLTYIFVTHNLSVVKHISNEILVMYVGSMVEKCETEELFKNPLHPYTKGLLAAIPVPNIDLPRKEIVLKGELTSPLEPKPGCRFANRCPYAAELCRRETPAFDEVEPNHFVACHYTKQVNGLA